MNDFIGETTNLLRRTPELLRTLLLGLPESWTDTADTTADGWRPRDVVGHLITGEQTAWIERTARLDELVTYKDLDRRGMHPTLGEVTLGPWKAYLGILLRREDPSAVAG